MRNKFRALLTVTIGLFITPAFGASPPPLSVSDDPTIADMYPKAMLAQQIPNEQIMDFVIQGEFDRINIEIDGKSNGIFIAAGSNIVELSFHEFASRAHPWNPQAQNSLIEDLQFISRDTSGLVEFQSKYDDWKGPPLPNLGGACDLSPCEPRLFGRFGSYGDSLSYNLYYRSSGGSAYDPTYGGHSPDIIQYDKARFESAKEAACNNELSSSILMAGAAAGAIGSCAGAVETLGAGTAICAGTIGGLVAAYKSAKADSKLCHTHTYPGPNKWER